MKGAVEYSGSGENVVGERYVISNRLAGDHENCGKV
jgi:hypothetical protein